MGNVLCRQVWIVKLATAYGKIIENDDMFELIQGEGNLNSGLLGLIDNKQIWYFGRMHVVFGIDG